MVRGTAILFEDSSCQDILMVSCLPKKYYKSTNKLVMQFGREQNDQKTS